MDSATTLEIKPDNKFLVNQFRSIFSLPEIDLLFNELLSDPFYYEVINSKPFKRLFFIPFLGALSYIDNNDKTKTRGHHSLGVALLAFYFAKINNYKKRKERINVVSSLLHDIHHLPFSHTMEIALKNEDFFSTKVFDQKILKQSEANDHKESLYDIGLKYKIDLIKHDIFLKITSEKPPEFKSTHNLDTIEGILRVYRNISNGHDYKYLPEKIIQDMHTCEMMKDEKCYIKNFDTYDEFWKLKNLVYSRVIYDEKKIFFERLLSYYLWHLSNEKDVLHDVHKMTDQDFFNIFPQLKKIIKLLWHYINMSNKHFGYEIDIDNKSNAIVKRKAQTKSYIRICFDKRHFRVNNLMNEVEANKVKSLGKRYTIDKKPLILLLDPNAITNLSAILNCSIGNYIDRFATIRDDILL